MSKAASIAKYAFFSIGWIFVVLFVLPWLLQPITGIPVSAWHQAIGKAMSSVVSQTNALRH
ncbi:MAG: hypothetical protein JSS86_22765 [Cyanobacteria bacterium SZAS LIN-2]|nr:hypothetical protein [Cyanobacteria bacterium SZAS LIN-2]